MHPPATVRVSLANLTDAAHARAVVELLDHYARDIMGGGQSLSEEVRANIVPRIRETPGSRVFLAWENSSAVGLAICFSGLSTFQARPLLNIHDVAVHQSARGRGIGRALLTAIETEARVMGCCKLTLEVREDNHGARHLYESFGFYAGQRGTSAMSFFTMSLKAEDQDEGA